MSHPPQLPYARALPADWAQLPGVFLFDGDCAMCTATMVRGAPHLRTRAALIPWQWADLAALGVPVERCHESVVFVRPDRRHATGAVAIGALLRTSRSPWPVVGRVLLDPVARPLAERVYASVARHRHQLPGGTPACRRVN